MSDRLSHVDGGQAFQEAVGRCVWEWRKLSVGLLEGCVKEEREDFLYGWAYRNLLVPRLS